MDVSQLRRNYTQHALHRRDLKPDPFQQFEIWFEQACRAEILEPNALTLATAWADGQPTQRTVLMKGFDAKGLVFFTNYGSGKAQQIGQNPRVSALFPWLALERQVIIQGTAARIGAAASLKYFLTRPLESRLGAWASNQSSVISSRKMLEQKMEEVRQRFRDGKVPIPSWWGGYRITPHTFEFWQGGPNRLHDRFLYTSQPDGSWNLERLAP